MQQLLCHNQKSSGCRQLYGYPVYDISKARLATTSTKINGIRTKQIIAIVLTCITVFSKCRKATLGSIYAIDLTDDSTTSKG